MKDEVGLRIDDIRIGGSIDEVRGPCLCPIAHP